MDYEKLDKLQKDVLKQLETTPVLLARVRSSGFQVLGVGSGRLAVILDDNTIAKIAYTKRGVRDNAVEWNVYHVVGEEPRKMLVEPLALTKGGVLVMKRCSPVQLGVSDPTLDITVRVLAQIGVSDVAVNLGVDGALLRCYDYAQVSASLLGKAADRHAKANNQQKKKTEGKV